MNHRLFSFLFLSAALQVSAQHPLITEHTWGPVPQIPERVKGMAEPIVILDRAIIVDRVDEGQDVVEYYLMHLTSFLRDAGAIDAENKVYINLNGTIDITQVKARSITPDGVVHELEKDAFKRATDDEERGSYLYFAFEGLVPGSIIDYYYVLKKRPDLRGDVETLQFGVPVLQERLHLLSPQRLVFKTKSYRGAPEAVIDTSDSSIQHLHWDLVDVPALEKEESAAMGAAAMRVVYALDRVTDRGLKDFSGYMGATKAYHAAIHQPIEGRTKKDLAALVKDMRLAYARDEEDKVRTIEDHLKNMFTIVKVADPRLASLSEILKNKACNEFGMNVLTCAVLREANITYQLVVTCDRMQRPFDPDFESYLFLQDVMLYFPTLDKYMAPAENGLRLGFLPSGHMANHGLFIRNYDVGGSMTGVGTVKYIPPTSDSATVHDHIITADLSADPGICKLRFENRISGYYAPLQCFYSLLDDEKKKELSDEMVAYLLENGTAERSSVENGESKFFGVRPFVIKGEVTTRKFSGTAGERVLFKVGELIGPQVEMYAEKPRKLPVDDNFNRRFDRSIDVVLPKGWTVQNLHDLEMDKFLEMDGQRVLSFKSTYSQEGDTLKVRIEEYYRRCQIPLADFEGYRRVVNAAADFNKVALVLVKH